MTTPIPPAVLDAATAAILKAQAYGTSEDEPEYTRENFERFNMIAAWQTAERYATEVLEAANIAKLQAAADALPGLVAALEALLEGSEDACADWSPSGENCQFFYIDQLPCKWCKGRQALAAVKGGAL